MKQNLRPLLLALSLLIVIGVIIGVVLSQKDGPVEEATSDIAQVKVEIKPDTSVDQSDVTVAETDESKEGTKSPTFSTVRVSPGKGGVIAGRAEPGSKVTVLDNGIALGSVYADTNGEWVLIFEQALESGDRELSLVQESADGRKEKSKQVVVVSVPTDGDIQSVSIEEEQLQETTISISKQAEGEDSVIAILMDKDGGGPSQVLQGDGLVGDGALGGAEINVRSIDYDSEGSVTLAGQTEPKGVVNIYLDGDYVGSAKANEDGEWNITLDKEIKPGKHVLRVDRIDGLGLVLSRIETPISRADPEQLLLGDAQVVVQPGNSLWRIARRAYGGGVYYTEIYGANKSTILDPDLIFPGQILTLPVLNSAN